MMELHSAFIFMVSGRLCFDIDTFDYVASGIAISQACEQNTEKTRNKSKALLTNTM